MYFQDLHLKKRIHVIIGRYSFLTVQTITVFSAAYDSESEKSVSITLLYGTLGFKYKNFFIVHHSGLSKDPADTAAARVPPDNRA